MRTEFVQTESRKAALAQCPWAIKFVKVDGGYRCFESIEDYRVWKSQK